jgi:lipopolysaccharide/colanic/teichoic acid biosynthesis glycosyltransferase
MRLDLRYADEWSLANDLALICRTIPVVLGGAGER